MSVHDQDSLYVIENIVNSLVSSATVNRSAHLALVSNLNTKSKKFGIIDSETTIELEEMIKFGLCSVFEIEQTELDLIMKNEIPESNLITEVLFESNIQNQRITYNPSKNTWNNNSELNAIAFNGGDLSSLLYLLTLSPTFVKLVIKLICDNVDKGDTRKEFCKNIHTLLEEISSKILSEPMKRISFLLDRIFDRSCDYLDEIIEKQVIRVYMHCGCIVIELLGDYRARILEMFVNTLYNINIMDTNENIDGTDSKSIKTQISEYLPNMNIDLLENFIKQTFHDLNKKK